VLFIDGRKLGTLIPGSRKQKQLSDEEIERVASVYRTFRREETPDAVPGFCAVASLEEIREHHYALTPGRYVGAEEIEDDGEPFEEKYPRLVAKIEQQFAESRQLEDAIRENLTRLAASLPGQLVSRMIE
jgi:type I restriction enzyme M protein